MKYAKIVLLIVCMLQINLYGMENGVHHGQIVVQNEHSENHNQKTITTYNPFNFNFFRKDQISLNQNGVFDFNSYMRQNSKTWQTNVFNYHHNHAKENNVSVSAPAIWVEQDSITMECSFTNEPHHECNNECHKYNTNLKNAIFKMEVRISKETTILENTQQIHRFIMEYTRSKLEKLETELAKKDTSTLQLLKQNNEGHEAAKEAEKNRQNKKRQNRSWYEKHPKVACVFAFTAGHVVSYPIFYWNLCAKVTSFFFGWLTSKKAA